MKVIVYEKKNYLGVFIRNATVRWKKHKDTNKISDSAKILPEPKIQMEDN